jgi:hypothetical protein
MSSLRIEKVVGVLPGTLTANTMYMLKIGSSVEIHITDDAGTVAYKASGESDLDSFFLMGAQSD